MGRQVSPWRPPLTSSVPPDLWLNQRAPPLARSGIPLITGEWRRRWRKMVRGKEWRTFCTSLLLVNQQESAVHVPDGEIRSAIPLCSNMTCSVVTTQNLPLFSGLSAALRGEDPFFLCLNHHLNWRLKCVNSCVGSFIVLTEWIKASFHVECLHVHRETI